MTQPIKKILKKCLPSKHTWKINLLENWKTIMGTLASSIFIHTIQGKQLTISAPHSSWAAELHAMSCTIITRINQTLGKPYIDKIRCIVRGRSSIKKSTRTHTTYTVLNDAPRTYRLPAHILKSLQDIADPDMQCALKDYWMRCARGKSNEAQHNVSASGQYHFNHTAPKRSKV